jgi:hypothetical protein
MNLLPGTKVAVRRGNDFFEGIVTRTEIVDGEQYVIGEWTKKIKGPQGTLRYDKFRAHIDDVKLWSVGSTASRFG